jgi:rhodanese-related sulfurtransferase
MLTRRRAVSLALCALSLGGLLAGCDGDPVNELTVDEVSSLLAATPKAAIFDANGQKIRQEYGVIPGAKLLNDASDYDLASTLPADKAAKLIFYCASTWCSAASTAAKRARHSGYVDVNVLPDGIKGWTAAGKATEQI